MIAIPRPAMLLVVLGAFAGSALAAQPGDATPDARRYYAAAPSTAMIDEDPNVLVVTAFQDEVITRDVVFALAGDSRLSGRIGVETERGIVSLTGLVANAAQVRHAARAAAGVDGVRDVENLLRARVGPTQ
ncbi:MAG TPA: BON domain-containing protein [Usitatibacter sp.]|nr:BON domain-containing protein [Usitatibacter sp.]